MKDERYVVEVQDRLAHTDKQLFGACGQAEHLGAIPVAGLVVFSL